MRPDRSHPPTAGDAERLASAVHSAPGLLCGLDFDGTLAPIVTDPSDASIDPAVVEPLERLAAAASVRVAVVSGRALSDLADRVPIEGAMLAGNHGLERQHQGERETVPAAADAREAIGEVAEEFADRLGSVPGCRIEDKGLTLSVHVREMPGDRVPAVRSTVTEVVSRAPTLCLVEGKAVFEVRPATDHDKGTAMTDLLADVPDDWFAVYVGDDTTDEDAFRALQPEGVGIHVADDRSGGDTAADYTLPVQSAVAPFLRWLAEELADG